MSFESIPSVSVTEAAKHADGSGVAFIDVRTPAEYGTGHAEGAASYPLDRLDPETIAKLKSFATVYVICQSGGRSSMAVARLLSEGVNAINVSGGTSAWQASRLPMR